MRPLTKKHAGLITAAGASSRMGEAKALLPLGHGQALAAFQVDRLVTAGCAQTVIVLGCDGESIQTALEGCHTVLHPGWEAGRLSSVQAGLRVLPGYDGYLILPVDAPGIRPETINTLLVCAENESHAVIRPTYQNQPGHLAWISPQTAEMLTRTPFPDDTPLHQILNPLTHYMPTHDPAILKNINTPAEWAIFLAAFDA